MEPKTNPTDNTQQILLEILNISYSEIFSGKAQKWTFKTKTSEKIEPAKKLLRK